MNEKMLRHFGTDSINDSAIPTTKRIDEQLHKDEDAELKAKAKRALVIARHALEAKGFSADARQTVEFAVAILAKMK